MAAITGLTRGRLNWSRLNHSPVLYGALEASLRVGANVLLLPLMVRQVTPSELALWWMFVALGAAATLADFGFGRALTRVYSYLWAGADDFDTEGLRSPTQSGPNLPRLRQLHRTAGFLYRRVAWLALVALGVGGTALLWRPAQSSPDEYKVWLAWAAFLLAVIYGVGTSHWSLACQGVNRVRDVHRALLWSSVVYVLTAAFLLTTGYGLLALVLATALRVIVARSLVAAAYHRAVLAAPGDGCGPDRSMLKRLWPNAWKFGLASIGGYMVIHSGVLVSARLLSDEITASYGLTNQIGLMLISWSGLWLTVKWPEVSILRAQGRLDEMSRMFARRLAWVMATFTVLALAVLLFGNRLLTWKGVHTGLLPAGYLAVYLLHMCQLQFSSQFGALRLTQNAPPFYIVSFSAGLVLLVLSLVMTTTYGLWGLILAPLLVTVSVGWYGVWRGFRSQTLTVRGVVRAAVSAGSSVPLHRVGAERDRGESRGGAFLGRAEHSLDDQSQRRGSGTL